MKVAVIGSTGVVGNVMLSLLESRNFPLSDLIPVASERSIGKKILFKEKHYNIVSIEDAIKMKPDKYEPLSRAVFFKKMKKNKSK